MTQARLDLSRVFALEPHGPDTYVGESPRYEWGRIYGGLVVAQALRAATLTVRPEHDVHSLHAYFILGGDLAEPVRYEVDRVRNGRSFTTRRVVARQSAGAILTLGCSFQVAEEGPATQSASLPEGLPQPDALGHEHDAGAPAAPAVLAALPAAGLGGGDPRLHACALAYLSDMNAMSAVHASYPDDNHDCTSDPGGTS